MTSFQHSLFVLCVVSVFLTPVLSKQRKCTKTCDTGYECSLDDNGKQSCHMQAVIVVVIVIACLIFAVLCPLVSVGMFFCGAFACFPKLFQKSVNRILYSKRHGQRRKFRPSYSMKKRRAERAARKKKKKLGKEYSKTSVTITITPSIIPPEGSDAFTQKSFEQGDQVPGSSAMSGKSMNSMSSAKSSSVLQCESSITNEFGH
ncbi:hypothetical protein L596_011865 [Steinernema carpocapsae]|uniref:Uncharacterized protein n=1 Tax=Steinernema carpocapsae TaxID=34508 RepID=A0A4U5NW76_STECR|nr:hypothetical protein L596_011865 [Steinernema carpocapsae]